uniref:Transmembrane protein 63A n=1 Tax=Xiphophorus couchianus TaxID=32473 RepID=A0A3B5LIM2_9TELE
MSALWPMISNATTPISCFSSNQSTVLSGLDFGGVPVVLLLNFCVFIVLLLLFSIIRKKFWDYGRLALVADNQGFNESKHRRYGRMSSTTSNSEDPDYELGFCSWLPYIVRMDEEKIKEKCGMDAVHYLSFQRHLIILLVVITVTSLAIILPVNMSGNLFRNDPQSFGRTTIGNLSIQNNFLWLHTVFAVVYLCLTVVMLRLHTSKIKDMRRERARNTLFVCSIPKGATDEQVKTHFINHITMSSLCLCLFFLLQLRVRAGKNLRYYERILDKTGVRELITPHVCGHFCCCSSCERAFAKLQSSESVLGKHCSILKDFNAIKCGWPDCCCGREPQPSSVSRDLNVNKWRVSFAPHPKSVYWENLSVHGFCWVIRWLGINLFLFILLTFLTTPTIIINVIDKFNVTNPIYNLNSPIISQFFPTLLLWSFSALLPTIVYYSTLGEAHWSMSSEQLSMMRKLYFFLLFMVLILPSLGLTRCVFLPDQGAFFVNYVIAAGLVGSGMELLRLPGLLLYTIRLILARSAAERKYVQQHQAYEFEYGAMYGWTLCVFTVIMAYSIICPVIVPFGLLYMLLKHLVDRHNLFFAYLPTRLDRSVHLGAVDQALAAPIICLIWLYFFSVLRAGFKTATSVFTLVVLSFTVFICLGFTCFGHFKYLSPHNYTVKEEDQNTIMEDAINANPLSFSAHLQVYLPRVLDTQSPATTTKEPRPQQSYGSLDNTLSESCSPVESAMEHS